jgi:DNA end-binding protein Ku
MRNLWSGYISFGLVTIPVSMVPATESKSVSFNFVHAQCGSPLKYDRVCTQCNLVIPWRDVSKGYEYEKGKWVTLEEEDFKSIPFPQSKNIDIVQFADLSEIDPVFYDRSYYLAPEEGAEKAYALLTQVMQLTNRIAVAKIVIKTKQHLCCIRHFQKSLILETMYYPDEIRSTEEITGALADVTLRPNEMKMARQLLDSMTERFEPDRFQDEYRRALIKVLESKISGIRVETKPEVEREEPESLIEALKASVRTAKESSLSKGAPHSRPQ